MAYVIKKTKSDVVLPYLPAEGQLKDGRKVILDYYKDEDEAQVHAIMTYIVNEEGDSYPQEDLADVEDFRAYYLSHDVFVCRDVTSGEVIGSFYVKPNFPGRSSHICNAGFAVSKSSRGQGAGKFMVGHYLQIARDLGYQASFFNLVFVSNETSVKLWRSMGFTEIGRVPNAGNLKGRGFTDALQFYYDLTKIEKKV
ncbi:L-azetidine-2-carboxylic acid acetyltransferase-like [Mizuhopecten yessoensis]|uniref:L-azetidine-2-carboxylic acid acetyltransferase n=1 Tax=Mizuhopecten yessoensis TaxID=6573 RepID=A0A210PL54_MIZYE|nr:L-azetidine-2-carboxylic acid acetyltransferase-like [Mizuhopecten yessoensis]XP_021339342.1 L-azetidine-2-carboxylic acid acetyltransferase-like [Mizuhopecten yessoensis]OWF37166.1 L-azetidine-2-carboxylic acid acetyltransferase [Mizuhopecten yessoensis]